MFKSEFGFLCCSHYNVAMPTKLNHRLLLSGIWLILFSLVLGSCTELPGETATVVTLQTTEIASSVPMPLPTPTQTEIPVQLALRVNQQGITLEEYEAQKTLLLLALEQQQQTLTGEEINQLILDYFVNTELLAQAANLEGYMVTAEILQDQLNALKTEAGGEETFQSWLTEQDLSEALFLALYQRELAAAWKRDEIVSSITTAEQVQARQILVSESDLAEQVYRQLQSGADFATQAETYDPLTKGALGWFPRGFLFVPEIEEAAFALAPGQYSEVIETDFGYHIIQVIAREEDRLLTGEARQAVAHQALEAWLEEQRNEAQIEILLP